MRAMGSRRAARGAAAVELALSMLVIIPVFLYTLFLDDLLRYALEGQEAALATVWDYTVLDYGSPPKKGEDQSRFVGFGLTQGFARQMYCDHESGIDSFDSGEARECADTLESEAHHQAVSAHACWLNPGAQQVQCELRDDVGQYSVEQHDDYKQRFGRGGLIRCSSRLGVQNYLLQRKVFAQFSKVDLAREKQERGSGIHSNAQQGTYQEGSGGVEGNVYLLPQEQMSILTDTWALTRQVDIRPGTTGSAGGAPSSDVAGTPDDLYERVLHQYEHQDNPGFRQMEQDAVDFVEEAVNDPRKPSIGMSPHREGANAPEETITQQGSRRRYFNSEWKDWDQDRNEQSYNERGNWYMGCNREESC